MFRRRTQHRATGELIEIGMPVTPNPDARLGDAITRGRELAEAGLSVRSQREYERWKDDVGEWRTAMAETLEASFPSAVARDALLEV